MKIPRELRWLWNVLVVIGMLHLIWTRQWWAIIGAVLVGFALGFAAVVYERRVGCLPWAHEWDVVRVSVPLWDISARGELRTCVRCGKVSAR
jgi:hypothetical protein